jgi:hypothetical protein
MNKWHFLNFKIKWDKKFPVNFFIDLMVIDLLINPAIETFKPKLTLWRLHRSATEDGHILRFIFYTTSEISEEIFKNIEANKFYTFIEENYLEDLVKQEGSQNIEGAGDGHWPPEINKSWPYYIMGVSDMFIKLIKRIKENIVDQVKENNKEELENYYKEIEKKIDEIWLKYGCHAFIHHLSAIIGYKPVIAQIRGVNRNSGGVIF